MNNFIPSRDPYPDFVNQYIDESRGIDSNNALTPKGLIEQIVNLITCGVIQQKRQEKYEEFKEDFSSSMMKSIDKNSEIPLSYEVPEHIKFQHLKHTVIITKNHFEAAQIDTHTRIEIRSQGENIAIDYLENEAISNFYTAKMLVMKGVISEDKIVFMPNGKLNLCNADFYKKNLTGINLSHANLQGVNFARANLTNAKLDHACVDEADFTGANLENVSNSETDFTHAIMSGVAEMQSNAKSPIMYSRSEKYREDTISEICTLIKKSYQREQSQSRNVKSDGLFRTSSHVEELKFASQAFNNKILDLKKTPLSCLTKIINNELATLIALRAEVAEAMIATPKDAKKILRQEIKGMHPIEKKLLSMLLELYADAYKNADDNNNSTFNKSVVLFSLTSVFLEPIMLNKSLTPVQGKALPEKIAVMLKELLTTDIFDDDVVAPAPKKKQSINFIKHFLPMLKKANKQ